MRASLSADLRHSLETFQDLELRRRSALERENRLLANLPSLKALMTSGDARTIADGAVEFRKTSGNDLFALADADGRVLTAGAQDAGDSDDLKRDLQAAIKDPGKYYFLSDGRMYEYTVQPLFFGPSDTGTLLGFVISGYVVDHAVLQEIGRGAGAQAAFVTGNRVLVSSWSKQQQAALQQQLGSLRQNSEAIVVIGPERLLIMGKDVPNGADVPLRLLVMKSLDQAYRAERDIDRLFFLTSLLVIAAGSVLMLLLARMVTRPLELLASGVRAFGEGDTEHSLPTWWNAGSALSEPRFSLRCAKKIRSPTVRCWNRSDWPP